ncbi:hypothetical protein NKJ09_23000 [Mesorhizobium sp. M0189]|uniref:hypothetical protein n=1 Tax=Mesorhizobium sp. M0189 TaxID=2956909 RepID=UPI003337A1EF
MADPIFINVLANGNTIQQPDVYLSFYGPKGGTRATESIQLEAARKLRDDLIRETAGDIGDPGQRRQV